MSEKQHYSAYSSVSDSSYVNETSSNNSDVEYERSFSTLKRITSKTYLMSTMSEQRLDDLTILSIER